MTMIQKKHVLTIAHNHMFDKVVDKISIVVRQPPFFFDMPLQSSCCSVFLARSNRKALPGMLVGFEPQLSSSNMFDISTVNQTHSNTMLIIVYILVYIIVYTILYYIILYYIILYYITLYYIILYIYYICMYCIVYIIGLFNIISLYIYIVINILFWYILKV